MSLIVGFNLLMMIKSIMKRSSQTHLNLDKILQKSLMDQGRFNPLKKLKNQ